MHLQLFPVAAFLLSQLAAAVYIPGTSIRIDIGTDNDNTQVTSDYSRSTRLGLQDPLFHLTGAATCRNQNPDTSDTECGDKFKSLTQCPSYCSCGADGTLSCPATDKCEADYIKVLCAGLVECGCKLSAPKCVKKSWPVPSLCGGGFKSANDCPNICTCDKDGNVNCKEAGLCSSVTLTAYCKFSGSCTCFTQ